MTNQVKSITIDDDCPTLAGENDIILTSAVSIRIADVSSITRNHSPISEFDSELESEEISMMDDALSLPFRF